MLKEYHASHRLPSSRTMLIRDIRVIRLFSPLFNAAWPP